MSQEYLLEYFSWGGARNPDRVVFRIFGEERIKQFNIQELDENVTVILRLDAHESDGRWYNEVSATNVIREGATSQPQPTVNQRQGVAQQSSANQQPEQQQGGGDYDDLPF
jgi:tyrosine-protein phosphatase YwqE